MPICCCSGCNYVCSSRACIAVLHDEATKTLFGCMPEDIYNITTGRLPSLSGVPSRPITEDGKVHHQPTGVLSHDRIEIGSSSDSELDLFEDDDDGNESEDEDDEAVVASVADRSVGTSCTDLIILVDVAVQTEAEEVRKQTYSMFK